MLLPDIDLFINIIRGLGRLVFGACGLRRVDPFGKISAVAYPVNYRPMPIFRTCNWLTKTFYM